MPLIQQSTQFGVGVNVPSGTSGSVLFIDSSGNLSQDNTNFQFNDSTNSLTLGGNLLFTTNDVSTIGVTGTRPNKVWVGTGGIETTGNLIIGTSSTGSVFDGAGVVERYSGGVRQGYIQFTASAILRSDVAGNSVTLSTTSTGFTILEAGSFQSRLYVPASNTIEQRNGTNAQTFSVYDTYTDASNYRRFSADFSSGYARLKPSAAGTGVASFAGLIVGMGDASTALFLDTGDTTYFRVAASAKIYLQSTHISPVTTDTMTVGLTGQRWNKGWFGSGGLDLNLSGSLSLIMSAVGGNVELASSNATVILRGLSAVSISATSGAYVSAANQFLTNGTNYIYGTPSSTSYVWNTGSCGNTITQRNGLNNQNHDIEYYTDASNYNRGRLQVSGTAFLIENTSLGTYAGFSTLILRSQSYIAFDATTGHIDFRFAAANKYRAESTGFVTDTNDTMAIGGTSNRWNKGWFGSGGLDVNGTIITTSGIFYTGGTTGLRINSLSNFVLQIASTEIIGSGNANEVTFRQGAFVGFSSSSTLTTSSPDTGWRRGSNGLIEQYNSTTNQTYRVYRRRDDASNYSYVELVGGTQCQVRTVGAGTIPNPDLILAAGNSTSALTLAGASNLATFNVTVFPSVSDSYAFGGTSNRWNKGWFGSGGLNSTGPIVYTSTGTLTISEFAGTTTTYSSSYSLNSFVNGTSSQAINLYRTYTSAGNYAACQLGFVGNDFYIANIASTASTGGMIFQSGTNLIEQRNGANSQTFNIYKSYTDVSNYSLFTINQTGGYWYCRPVAVGTGTITGVVYGSSNYETYLDGNIATGITFRISTNTRAILSDTTLSLTPLGLSGSGATSAFTLTQTLNTSGSPTMFLANYLHTASGVTTALFDWQYNSVSQLSLRKTGELLGSNGNYLWLATTDTRLYCGSTNRVIDLVTTGSASSVNIVTGSLGLSATTNNTTVDVRLWRDAAATLALRNGTNAQTFNIYNTYTDVSNYERGFVLWASNLLQIGTEQAGTGTARNVYFKSAGGDYTFESAGSAKSKYASGTGRWEFYTPIYSTANGAASTAAINPIGTIYTGGTATTTFPYYYHNVTGAAAVTSFSTAGTFIGVNAGTGFVGSFLDFHVDGGASRFKVTYNGTRTSIETGAGDIWFNTWTGVLGLTGKIGCASTGAFVLDPTSTIGWTNAGSNWYSASQDLMLNRDAAYIFAWRNGTNPHSGRIYRTYTDASNYAYLEQTWSGNNALIRTVGLGTGTVGNLILQASTGPTLTFSSGVPLCSSGLQIGGLFTLPGSSGINFNGTGYLKSSTDGLINLTNAAITGFTRLTLGPESVNFPSLKVNSGVGVEIKTGNDATFMDIKTMSHTFDGSTPSALVDGMIWFDGTDLKIRVSGVTYTLTKA